MQSITVPGKTVNELLQYWASTPDWDTPAFVSVNSAGEKECINRKEVLECAGRFAYKLLELGVTKGSIVYSSLPNSIERVICDMGIYLSGAISLSGQIFHSDGRDFLNSLKLSKAQFVIIDHNAERGPHKILKKVGLEINEGHVKCPLLPHLHHIIFCQRNRQEPSQDFLGSLQNSKLNQTVTNMDPSDLATIMITSGSTGYSKLVQLTHANLCHFCVQVKTIEPFKGGERFINCAPLGWAGGFPQWYLGCGVTRYFIDMYDDPPENLAQTLWQTIVKERIIYGFVSPMYVSEILGNPDWWSNSEWKPNVLCMAGQPIKKSQLDIIGKLCSAVDINYGMTEGDLVTTHRITDPSSFKDGCAGYPGNGVSIKIVDKERNELPQGAIGEILIQSPSLFLGYLNNDEASNHAFTSDGWFCTDDAGYMDSEGKMYVEGRQSDSILRGAYILYPGWLEGEIRKLNKVKDVVIVAVPDPVLHNEICACIVTDCIKDADSELVYVNDHSSPKHSFKENENKFDNSQSPSLVNGADEEESPLAASSYPLRSGQLEHIRVRGMKKPLNVGYNLTKAKSEEPAKLSVTSVQSGSENDNRDSLLKTLEMEIRHFCDQSQVLAEKDAMRMVPKYYLFLEKFPITGTGKISRKEIRQQASIALNLL